MFVLNACLSTLSSRACNRDLCYRVIVFGLVIVFLFIVLLFVLCLYVLACMHAGSGAFFRVA